MTNGEVTDASAAEAQAHTPDAIDAWIEELREEVSASEQGPAHQRLAGRLIYETGLPAKQAWQRIESLAKTRGWDLHSISRRPFSPLNAILGFSLLLFGFALMLGGSGAAVIGFALLCIGLGVVILSILDHRRGDAGRIPPPKLSGWKADTVGGMPGAVFSVLAYLSLGIALFAGDVNRIHTPFLRVTAVLTVLNAAWTLRCMLRVDWTSQLDEHRARRVWYLVAQCAAIALTLPILSGKPLDAHDLYYALIPLQLQSLVQPRLLPINWKLGGNTALHRAIEAKDSSLVAKLLALKPDLAIRDAARRTPLELAESLGAAEIAAQLRAAGAAA